MRARNVPIAAFADATLYLDKTLDTTQINKILIRVAEFVHYHRAKKVLDKKQVFKSVQLLWQELEGCADPPATALRIDRGNTMKLAGSVATLAPAIKSSKLRLFHKDRLYEPGDRALYDNKRWYLKPKGLKRDQVYLYRSAAMSGKYDHTVMRPLVVLLVEAEDSPLPKEMLGWWQKIGSKEERIEVLDDRVRYGSSIYYYRGTTANSFTIDWGCAYDFTFALRDSTTLVETVDDDMSYRWKRLDMPPQQRQQQTAEGDEGNDEKPKHVKSGALQQHEVLKLAKALRPVLYKWLGVKKLPENQLAKVKAPTKAMQKKMAKHDEEFKPYKSQKDVGKRLFDLMHKQDWQYEKLAVLVVVPPFKTLKEQTATRLRELRSFFKVRMKYNDDMTWMETIMSNTGEANYGVFTEFLERAQDPKTLCMIIHDECHVGPGGQVNEYVNHAQMFERENIFLLQPENKRVPKPLACKHARAAFKAIRDDQRMAVVRLAAVGNNSPLARVLAELICELLAHFKLDGAMTGCSLLSNGLSLDSRFHERLPNERFSSCADLKKVPCLLVVVDRLRMGDTLPSSLCCMDIRGRYRRQFASFSTLVQDAGRTFGWDTALERRPMLLVSPLAYRALKSPVDEQKLRKLSPGKAAFRAVDSFIELSEDPGDEYASIELLDYLFLTKAFMGSPAMKHFLKPQIVDLMEKHNVTDRRFVLCAFPQIGKTGAYLCLLHYLAKDIVPRYKAMCDASKQQYDF